MTNASGGWRKSSYSGNEYECVEVAPGSGHVRVRDSTDRLGPELQIPAPAWQAFVADVTSGRLAGPWPVSARRETGESFVRPARELLLDQALQRRAWAWLRRSAAYALGGGLALVAAGAASLAVDHPAAKLTVWTATLLLLLLLWGAGVWAWERFKMHRSTTGTPHGAAHHRHASLPDQDSGRATTAVDDHSRDRGRPRGEPLK